MASPQPRDTKGFIKNMKKVKWRDGIISQVLILMVLGILTSGIITFLTQKKISNESVKEQMEVLSAQTAQEVMLAIKEYPAYEWLIDYWYTHSDEMNVEYDVGYFEGTKTERKTRELIENNPAFSVKYAETQDINLLSDEYKKLYAEITYTWLTNRIDQIKRTYKVDYLFALISDPPYEEQFFLFSGADAGAKRGQNYEEVYTLGTIAKVSESQQKAMSKALKFSEYLADAGAYVDYYAAFNIVNGHPVLIGVTYNLAEMQKNVESETWSGTVIAIGYQILLSAIFMISIYFLVLRPLKKVQASISLYGTTKSSELVEKNLGEVHLRNEIGQLAGDVVSLTKDIDDYVKQIETITAEEQRISTELTLASRIQASTLPSQFPPFPHRKEFDIFASMDPAKEVGGDFYDFFLIDDDHLVLAIADVSGKGVPASLFMMISMIRIRNAFEQDLSPANVLKKVNEQTCANNPEEMFVSVWLGILEISTGRLTAVNAGHEYPAMAVGEEGQFEIVKDKHGFVVGGMEGIRFRDYTLQLEPGSKIFVYTDGVPEATDKDGNLFGLDRMLEALNSDPKASLSQILTNVRASVDSFVQEEEQFDDLTMMCLVYKGPQEQTEQKPKEE